MALYFPRSRNYFPRSRKIKRVSKGSSIGPALLFLTFSALLVANPKKTNLHDGQSRSWSAEQEKKKKKKSGSTPPPPRRAARSEKKNVYIYIYIRSVVDVTRLSAWLRSGEGIGWLAAGAIPNSLYCMIVSSALLLSFSGMCIFVIVPFFFVVFVLFCCIFLLSVEFCRCFPDADNID